MPPDFRFYKSKRWCHECQTHIEIEVQDCEEEAGPAPMGFDILSALKFVIPAERAYTVETGNLYVRRHNGGKEFVRKRTVKCDCKDTMCKKCKHGNDSRRGSGPDLAREYAAKAVQQRHLEAELARAEERELRERIGIRERRPYQFSTERKDSTPPENAAEMHAERPCRRRMSYAIDESPPHFYHVGHCKKHQQQHHQHNHHRPSHHHAHHEERRYVYAPRQPEYYVQEIEPPASCRRNGRRPSRIISNNVYHDDVPIFCSRIITGGRRKSSSGGCRRASRRYSRYYPDVQFESREPEDYYY